MKLKKYQLWISNSNTRKREEYKKMGKKNSEITHFIGYQSFFEFSLFINKLTK